MGVFFHREPTAESLRAQFKAALQESGARGPFDVDARADELAKEAQKQAPVTFDKWSFLIALGLLLLFLAIAIVVDAYDLVDDPTVYTGLVSTVLGAVLGFLGGEASGSASG